MCDEDGAWTGDIPGATSKAALFSTAPFCRPPEGDRQAAGLALVCSMNAKERRAR